MNKCNRLNKTPGVCPPSKPSNIPCESPTSTKPTLNKDNYAVITCPFINNKPTVNIKKEYKTTYLNDFRAGSIKDYMRKKSFKVAPSSRPPWMTMKNEPHRSTNSCFFVPKKLPLKPLVNEGFCKEWRIRMSVPMENASVARLTWGKQPTKKEVLLTFKENPISQIYPDEYNTPLSYPKRPPRPYDYSKLCENHASKPLLVPRKLRQGVCWSDMKLCS